VIATHDLSVARAIQRVLSRGLFRLYTNHDVVGCELGGALKNVVAIACGIAQGLGVGDNTRAMVMTRGLAELTRLGVAMGGEAATFAGLAGMGDLIATCTSPNSRNRTVGEQLGLGRPLEEITAGMTMVAEGIKTAVTAHELSDRHGVFMPVHHEIYRVVRGESKASQAYRGLRMEPGHESEPG
jgi:glycerol-3-phosphate dehydrogenase (NAD(P)+)